ncbi:MAG: C40 family peptidase [Bacteroidetes bacterium]|nr:C40 family peptidase [Bacteroidota bacterium]
MEQFAQCVVSVSPIRRFPNHQSEMVSQILFGESCIVLNKENDFCKIKMQSDNTEGWVFGPHLDCTNVQKTKSLVEDKFFLLNTDGCSTILSMGSEISEEKLCHQQENEKSLLEIAQSFLGVPFLQGGRTFMGCDADGFVQLVFKLKEMKLPRWAKEQSELGNVLDFLGESESGDLAFFEDNNGDIIHVGIMLNNHQIIHSYDTVRIDGIDNSGIYNAQLKKHTHQLRFVKRIK